MTQSNIDPAPRRAALSTRNLWARYTNAGLGAWLVLSAFIWPHSGASQTNTWIVGLGIAVVALVALRAPAARFLNSAMGAWLVISTWFIMPHVLMGTLWHNVLVGAAVFALSMVASVATPSGGASRQAPSRG